MAVFSDSGGQLSTVQDGPAASTVPSKRWLCYPIHPLKPLPLPAHCASYRETFGVSVLLSLLITHWES